MWWIKKMSDLAAGYWIGMLMGGMLAFVIAVVLVDWAWSKKWLNNAPSVAGGSSITGVKISFFVRIAPLKRNLGLLQNL